MLRLSDALFVVLNEREDIEAVQFAAAIQKGEFYGEGSTVYFAAELLNELGGWGSGAAGGEQVVANDDAISRLDGIFVDFQSIGTVLQCVGDAGGLGWELFWFANWNKAGPQTVGQCRGK